MIIVDRMYSCDYEIRMKRTTKNKIKDKLVNITIDLLENFMFSGEKLLAMSLSKKEAYKIFYNNYYLKYTEVPFAKWLYRLRESGYISYFRDSESIEFTFKTKLKLMKKIGSRIKESNSYHFLSFDIPEEKRRNRDSFRRAIKDLGYKKIQKSLWVINKDVFEIVESLAYEMKVEKFLVNVISAESDIDGVLDKIFIK